jgi:hypothetical protein
VTYGVECTDSVHTRVLAVQVCECVPGSVPHGGCHAADAEPSRHEHTGAVEEASPLRAALSQQRRAPGGIPYRRDLPTGKIGFGRAKNGLTPWSQGALRMCLSALADGGDGVGVVGTSSDEGGEWVRSLLGEHRECCLKTVSTAGILCAPTLARKPERALHRPEANSQFQFLNSHFPLRLCSARR